MKRNNRILQSTFPLFSLFFSRKASVLRHNKSYWGWFPPLLSTHPLSGAMMNCENDTCWKLCSSAFSLDASEKKEKKICKLVKYLSINTVAGVPSYHISLPPSTSFHVMRFTFSDWLAPPCSCFVAVRTTSPGWVEAQLSASSVHHIPALRRSVCLFSRSFQSTASSWRLPLASVLSAIEE